MSEELGTLVVVVLKARNLPDNHFFKQDVYTQVALQGVSKQTRVETKGGQHPEWDDELRFQVFEKSSKKTNILEITCWSKEPRKDEVVGKGQVDISDTLASGEFDDWIPLSTDKGQRGDIYLEMTWFSAGPSPAISRRPSKLKPTKTLSTSPSIAASSSPPNGNSLRPLTPLSPVQPAATLSAYTFANQPQRPESRSHSGSVSSFREEPPPPALPSVLMPGAGRPHPKQTNPHSRASSDSQWSNPNSSPPQQHHRQSVSSSSPVSGMPGFLGSGSPNERLAAHPPLPYFAEADISPISPGSIGSSPSTAPRSASSPQSTSYFSPQTPFPQQPPISRTPVPQQPGPVSVPALSPQPQSSPAPSLALPAWQTQPSYHQAMQPNAYNPPPVLPGFAFPSPHIPMHAPPTQPYYYPPPPPSPHSYPYNYPPLPRDPDFDAPEPAKLAKYQKPLPLPDSPGGLKTPTPSTPQPHVTSSPPHHTHHRDSSANEAERKRMLALREEEERRRLAREQEERDFELARQLDMQLNIENEAAARAETAIREDHSHAPVPMPGAWYRQRQVS